MSARFLVFSLVATLAGPQPASQQHAIITLVAEHASAVPGQPASVGLHFEIDPRWHIYWVNPGDSGGPPTMAWKLPEGFTASAFQWPAPQRIVIGGTVVNYGYEADVLLPLTINVPASAKAGTTVEIGGRVNYMICSELCVPARADVHLTLPIAASAGAASPVASVFAQTRARLPQPAPASWHPRATFANRQFELTIDIGTGGSQATAQFFPLIPGQIDDASTPPATPTARGLRFTLHASEQLTAAPRTLSGVIVVSETQAYTIDVPIATKPAAAK